MPESSFNKTIGHAVQMSDIIIGIDGIFVCELGFCQNNDDVHIKKMYGYMKYISIAKVYYGKSIFGYLIDRNNSGLGPPSKYIYDLFFLRKYNALSDVEFKSIISEISKTLNKQSN